MRQGLGGGGGGPSASVPQRVLKQWQFHRGSQGLAGEGQRLRFRGGR